MDILERKRVYKYDNLTLYYEIEIDKQRHSLKYDTSFWIWLICVHICKYNKNL